MKRLLKGLLAIALLGALLAMGSASMAAAVTPVLYEGWDPGGGPETECENAGRLGDQYHKFDGWGSFVDGSRSDDGVITIENPSYQSFDWTSTGPVYCVIVKASTYAYVYTYVGGAFGDTDLIPPLGYEISHVTFCCTLGHEELTVSKTAVTSFSREHLWDIAKKVETENGYTEDGFAKIWLKGPGDEGDERATWTIDVTYEGYGDRGFNVLGEITIANTGDLPAVITSIADLLGGKAIDVDCGVVLPHTLGDGGTLTCNYREDVDGKIAGSNEVTVKTQRDSYSASAAIEWGDPAEETNKTVKIQDISDLFGTQELGSVTAPTGGTFTYS